MIIEENAFLQRTDIIIKWKEPKKGAQSGTREKMEYEENIDSL